MTTGATLAKDVPEKPDHPSIDTDNILDEGRLNRLNELASKSREKDDFLPFDGDQVVEEEPEEPTEPTDKDSTDKEDKTEDDDSMAEKEPTDEMVTVKVYGEEKQVPKSKVDEVGGVTAYQMIAAAKEKFEEASNLVKEMQAERAKWLEQQGHSVPAEPQKTKEQIEHEEKLGDAKKTLQRRIKEFSQAQAYGSPEEIEKALVEYQESWADVNRLEQQQSYSQDDIDAIVSRKIQEREMAEQDRRNEEIRASLNLPVEKGGYKDLLEDERTYRLMEFEVNKLLNEGAPNRLETYKKAGDTIRDFLGRDKQQEKPQKKPSTAIDKKRERKLKSVDNIKTTGAVANAPNTDAMPKTREQIKNEGIAHLRKLRGQSVDF